MSIQRAGYRAYMLRLWPVRSQEGCVKEIGWRAVLEDVRTGERHGFASLEELFDFIRTGMEVKHKLME